MTDHVCPEADESRGLVDDDDEKSTYLLEPWETDGRISVVHHENSDESSVEFDLSCDVYGEMSFYVDEDDALAAARATISGLRPGELLPPQFREVVHIFGLELTESTSDPEVAYWPDGTEVNDETRKKQRCPACGLCPTPEGHDPCLGTLPGVRYACCGHGRDQGYIMFEDGRTIRGYFTEMPQRSVFPFGVR